MTRGRAQYGRAVPIDDADRPDWVRPASVTVRKTFSGEIAQHDGEIRSFQGDVVRTVVDDSITFTDPDGIVHQVRKPRSLQEYGEAIRQAGRTGMTERERIIRGAESKSKALADRSAMQEAHVRQLEQELVRMRSKYQAVVEAAARRSVRISEVEQGRQRTTPSRGIYISNAIGWGAVFVSTLFAIFF